MRKTQCVSGAKCRISGLFSLMLAMLFVLSGCASYAGRNLAVGNSTLSDVIAEMGEPTMRWQGPDGWVQLAYPRGPEGPHTFMVFVAPDGRMASIENVLVERQFMRIVPGATQEDVLRLIGPPTLQWTTLFQARDELVWEWRYCDAGFQMAKYDVLFDATSLRVRTAYSRPDYRGPDMIAPHCGQVPGR